MFAWFESLESRQLLAAPVVAQINFQPADRPTPAGYLADSGGVYGVRNGISYGWNFNNPNIFARDSTRSPDPRYDTVALMQRDRNYRWNLGVPAGLYNVRIVAGDPVYSSATYRITAEGVLTVSGTGSSTRRWLEGTRTVAVTDGRLTIANGFGASGNKIDFVEVSNAAPTALVANAASTTSATLTWQNNAVNSDGFQIDRSTDNVNFTGIATLTSTATTLTDSGLTPGTTYYYRVRAFNSTGVSTNATASVALPAPAPVPPPPPPVPQPPAAPPIGVNVRAFGAVGDGVTDDTAAIQLALDASSSASSGIDGYTPAGGIVYLPAGTYRTSAPLVIHTGTTLLGDGGSVIHNVDPNSNDAAILLAKVPADGNASVLNAGLRNLTIQTDSAYGVRTQSRIALGNSRFENLVFSTGNWSIYLPSADAYTQATDFTNIHFSNFGSGALWIDGNANRIDGLVTEGAARPGFSATPAMVRIGGNGNAIRNSNIGSGVPVGTPTAAYFVSGDSLLWRNNWQGVPTAAAGAAYQFDNLVNSDIDTLNGLDSTHQASFAASVAIDIRHLTLPPGMTADQALTTSGASAVRVESVANTATLPVAPAAASPLGAPLPAGLSVRSSGATGDGTTDDTAAIQRAIDAAGSGGVVYLPRGKYLTSAPLLLRSGVTLIGEDSGTIIYATDPNAADAAIQLVADPGTNTIQSPGVHDLKIWTASGYGISGGGTTPVAVQGGDFRGLMISAGNIGINLPSAQNSTIHNVLEVAFGSGAVWLQGDGNVIEEVDTEGGTRAGFAPSPAILRVGGNNNIIRGCIIEGTDASAPAVGCYVTGNNILWENNWGELGATVDNVAYRFENINGIDISGIHGLSPTHTAAFLNATNVQISTLSTNATLSTLQRNITWDNTSSLRIQEIYARVDSGSLDDPHVQIGGIWNSTLNTYLDVSSLNSGANLLTNGNFANSMDGWTVYWGPQMTGTASVETLSDGTKRLKVTVTSNPLNAGAFVSTTGNVPTTMAGLPLYVEYKLEADPGMELDPATNQQYGATAAMGSLTATNLGAVAAAQPVSFFIKGTSGNVYISNVKLAVPAANRTVFAA